MTQNIDIDAYVLNILNKQTNELMHYLILNLMKKEKKDRDVSEAYKLYKILQTQGLHLTYRFLDSVLDVGYITTHPARRSHSGMWCRRGSHRQMG